MTLFQDLINQLDQDPVFYGNKYRINSSPILQRFEKTSVALNEMV